MKIKLKPFLCFWEVSLNLLPNRGTETAKGNLTLFLRCLVDRRGYKKGVSEEMQVGGKYLSFSKPQRSYTENGQNRVSLIYWHIKI